MINAITTGVTDLITMTGSVVDAIVGTDGALVALLPLVGLGIAGTVVFFGIKTLKSLCWGM